MSNTIMATVRSPTYDFHLIVIQKRDCYKKHTITSCISNKASNESQINIRNTFEVEFNR